MPPGLPNLDILPWLGFAAQAAGAAILAFSGGFGLGVRKYESRGTAVGLAVFCAGSVSLVVFAVSERNFLLAGIQLVAAFLIGFGVTKKAGRRRNGP